MKSKIVNGYIRELLYKFSDEDDIYEKPDKELEDYVIIDLFKNITEEIIYRGETPEKAFNFALNYVLKAQGLNTLKDVDTDNFKNIMDNLESVLLFYLEALQSEEGWVNEWKRDFERFKNSIIIMQK